MISQRYLMSDIKKKYPDKWVILSDCEWENKSTVKSAVEVKNSFERLAYENLSYAKTLL